MNPESNGQPTLHRLATGTRELPVVLTSSRRLELAEQLAATFDDLVTEELDQADEKAAMKRRLTAITLRQRQLATTLRRGSELQPVTVHTIVDFPAGVVREIRTDTAEVLSVRSLKDDERQLPLTPEVAQAAEAAMVEHAEP